MGTVLVIPVHRKGSINDPDNYKGSALMDVMSKIYIGIVTKKTYFVLSVVIQLLKLKLVFELVILLLIMVSFCILWSVNIYVEKVKKNYMLPLLILRRHLIVLVFYRNNVSVVNYLARSKVHILL